jgi:8-oxo-dGTP pyrophosphatase MutT (NUDIX family)
MVTTRSNKTYSQKPECSIIIVRHPDDNPSDMRCAWHRRPITSTVFPGLLEVPGGKREHGESFLRAAYRELYEETGLQRYEITPLRRIHKIRIPPTTTFGYQFIYITTTRIPIHKWRSEDGTPWQWYNPTELLDSDMYNLGPYIREILLNSALNKHLLYDHM